MIAFSGKHSIVILDGVEMVATDGTFESQGSILQV